MLLALALAAQAPAKLIIMPPGQPALTLPYPSMDRCERAKAELLRQDHEHDADNQRIADKIGQPVIVRHLVAYCIPG